MGVAALPDDDIDTTTWGIDVAGKWMGIAGSAEYFMASNNYASFAGQYCAKVGNGWHDVRVVLESADWDSSGGDIAWLHNPMLNVEVAE